MTRSILPSVHGRFSGPPSRPVLTVSLSVPVSAMSIYISLLPPFLSPSHSLIPARPLLNPLSTPPAPARSPPPLFPSSFPPGYSLLTLPRHGKGNPRPLNKKIAHAKVGKFIRNPNFA